MANNDFIYVLPSLGADMDEASLLEWKIKPGERVKRGQVVATLETVKAAIDAEIWVDGVVEELLVQPDKDRKIKVGAPLARLKTDKPVEQPAVVMEAAPAAAKNPTPPTQGAIPHPRPLPLARGGVVVDRGGVSRLMISPAARRRMQELGIGEAELPALDRPYGIADIEQFAQSRQSSGPKTMREQIAKAMSRSKREIPHYYLATEINMTPALAWLRAENEKRSLEERMLPAVLLIRAVALAVARYPNMNGFYVNNAFKPSEQVHIGMAFALREGGLIAPAIHNTDKLALPELMKILADLGERTRTGGLKAAELADPTITITSLGDLGVEEIFPIITPPQVAMVGFGMLSEKPWVIDGKVEVREIMHATLAADHRVSDGRDGALFLSEVKDLLEQVEELIN
ncbi:MAG: dihydrolipoamide acetyltransferase family protein [Spirochaetota bacterium]